MESLLNETKGIQLNSFMKGISLSVWSNILLKLIFKFSYSSYV